KFILLSITMQKFIFLVFYACCCYGCKDRPGPAPPEVKLVSIEQKKGEKPLPPPPPEAIAASAYLIYDDETLSEFDILNDKTKALWNVVIGGGDAEKPSQKVMLVFHGAYDSINVNVRNGKTPALDKKNLSFNGKLEFIIQNTGCNEVFVNVTKNSTYLVRDTI